MISHQAVGITAPVIFSDYAHKLEQKSSKILFFTKDVLSVVPSRSDVVEGMIEFDSWQSWHIVI